MTRIESALRMFFNVFISLERDGLPISSSPSMQSLILEGKGTPSSLNALKAVIA